MTFTSDADKDNCPKFKLTGKHRYFDHQEYVLVNKKTGECRRGNWTYSKTILGPIRLLKGWRNEARLYCFFCRAWIPYTKPKW